MKSHSPMKSHTIVWEFDQPPDVIWPLFADTGRINEAAGLPKHRIREVEQADGTVRFFAEAKAGPFTLAWEEIPVEWVTDRWFRHERRFSRGPLAVLIATAEFEPTPGGCRCIYRMEAAPANLIGRLLLATRFFDDAGKNFDRLVDDLRRFAAGASKRPFLTKRVALDQARALRLERIVAEINASPNGHGLGTRLADYVLDAQEMDLIRMRPRRLAREWGEEDLPVIELCLEAVRDGLLESRWDLLCPRCRGAKLSASSLDQVPETAHCDSCNITYDRDFSRNVELSFQPAPAVRPVQDGEFCLFGPMSMPHVILQVALDPGESRTVPADLAPGAYRYRTLETGGQCDVAIDGPAPQVIVNGAVVQAGEPSAPGTVTLENQGDARRTLVVESRAWVADALTAHEVTTLQAFRDLFSNAVLHPGDQVSIAQIALMFTDLKGSTALYERIGDASAYHLVREHFAYLGRIVRGHRGAIVKTIGDSVMAAFAEPADAVRAALDVQQGTEAFNRDQGGEAISIKIGVHAGASIAVTLNDRLDYFGSMVNLAARVQGLAAGGEVVVSGQLAQDPSVAPLVAEGRRERARVRGIAEPVEVVRLPGDPVVEEKTNGG
ncbi:adenylate/guanylate cyclase domain-containing protein [Thalassobaculum salexigens]|uniref:adenylate/guanylate cyclase domain-containing protein n=2 Tax=Thalassobaculum salexigens TaxID=455360 RepID=UPI0004078644|nr:adenylate/guanylate cyclase domain-containing protein [Thalassobaculum salexigens]